MKSAPAFPAAALVVDGVSMRYDSSVSLVLSDVNFALPTGEFVVVVGPSGCGKSTLLRIVAGLERPHKGKVIIGSRKVADAAAGVFIPPERRGLGFVFQSYALWPHMDVKANISFPLAHGDATPRDRAQRLADVLDKFGLAPYQDRYPAELSGGQRQRAALARALVNRPQLLLMDEPLSSLDVNLRKKIQDELLEMRDQWQPTVLYVTHDQDEAIKLADRVIVLNEGRIQQQGTPYEIFHCPQNRFVAGFFGEANELEGTVVAMVGDGRYAVAVDATVPVIARSVCEHHPHEKVRILIRPSWVALRPDASTGTCPYAATVLQSRFMGANTYHALDWCGRKITVTQTAGAVLTAGETVRFKIKDAWIQIA